MTGVKFKEAKMFQRFSASHKTLSFKFGLMILVQHLL